MSGYIEFPLTTDPEDLEVEALESLMESIPGWVPQEGHLEVWMIEVWARMVSEARIVAGRVPLEIFRYFGQSLVGVETTQAASATASTSWTMVDTQGYTIPVGTVVGYRIAGDELVPFETLEEVVIPPGSTVAADVIVQAVEAGTEANTLGPSGLELIDSLAFVDTITAAAATSGGVDEETIADYLDRLRAELRLLTPRPILPQDFAILARRVPGVHRALGINLYEPPEDITDAATTDTSTTLTAASSAFVADDVGRTVTGPGIPASTTISAYVSETEVTMSAAATATADPVTVTLGARTDRERTVTVAVVDVDGAALTTAVKQEVEDLLNAEREINFVVYVIDPTYTTIDVDTTFTTSQGQDPAEVEAQVVSALNRYLSPAFWAGGDETPPSWHPETGVVRYLEVAAVVNGVLGVDYIETLTVNTGTADVPISGIAPLPQVGTITVGAVV